MKRVAVKFNQPDQIIDFVRIMNRYEYDVDVKCGSRIVDAKSIVGVLALAKSRTVEVIVHTDESCEDLMEEMISTAKETSNELGKLDGLSQEEADNIARIVGLGALKYFILKVDARKNMTFNPKESIDFNGNTGPFIQYTYARIQSVMRKAAEAGIVIPAEIPVGIELSEKEESLIQMVADFAAVVKQAGTDYSPSIIANYTYDLVKEYNQFYHDFSILREENEAVKVFRLALSENVAKVVRISMGLLGIEVPDRM